MTDENENSVQVPTQTFVTREQARRTLLYCGGAMGLILAIVIAFAGYELYQASRTTKALCSFRHDIENRIRNGENFLRTHPNGLPQVRITRADIISDLNARRQTVDSLRFLPCPPLPDPRP